MIENGTEVMVDGIKATVVESFASGRYRQYKLSDGRTVADLHTLVAENVAKVLPNLKETKVKPTEYVPKSPRHGLRDLPRDNEDLEE